ncbi:MAG: hypothetical protein PHE27_05880 [Alphaproteobacteria bacterium]|nr:hypothetical protein [Alphaproteobacteria bacterium]
MRLYFRSAFLFLALLGGCVDTSAVTKFAQTAPDQTKLSALADVWVALPENEIKWDIYRRNELKDKLKADQQVRQKQKKSLEELNGVLIAYMNALGAMSGSALSDTTAPAKSAIDGLKALKSSKALGITDAEIASVNTLFSFVANLAVSGVQQHELLRALESGEGPFQDIVSIERKIVKRGILAGIKSLKSSIRRVDDEAQETLPKDQKLSQIAAFALHRAAEEDLSSCSAQEEAAKAYIKALDNLSEAHTVLYESRNKLSKQTVEKILPYIEKIEDAYAALGQL